MNANRQKQKHTCLYPSPVIITKYHKQVNNKVMAIIVNWKVEVRYTVNEFEQVKVQFGKNI